MTCPPAFHIWKVLMKNMTPLNSGLTGRPVMQYSYAMYSLCRKINPARKFAKPCKRKWSFQLLQEIAIVLQESSKSLWIWSCPTELGEILQLFVKLSLLGVLPLKTRWFLLWKSHHLAKAAIKCKCVIQLPLNTDRGFPIILPYVTGF